MLGKINLSTILFGMAVMWFTGESIATEHMRKQLMKDSIFREYDIRGLVDDELVINEVYDLARAIAHYFMQHNPNIKTIAVGMDGRTHSPMIKNEICRGLVESGLDVVFVGICPSPALYFALHTLPVDGGLMITASHNPKEYNGIKICLGTESVWGKQIREIGAQYRAGKHIETNVRGTVTDHPIIPAYINWFADKFSHLIGMDLSVVIDCGNGAGGAVIPQLVKRMEWKKVRLLYEEVDGTFPNHEADPIVAKNMQDVKHALAITDAVVGVGLDGDADRMGSMTKQGVLVPGDKMLSVFAQSVLKEHPGASVVLTVIASQGLVELLDAWGAKSYMTPVGHSIVEQKMKEQDALLAGETSGHFFFRDRHFGYDDGIYAMFRLFEILTDTGKSLHELIAVFPKKVTSREFRVPCSEEVKWRIVEDVKQILSQRSDIDILDIDGVRATMNYGWGIIRPSNTQAVLSMRFESDTHEGLQKVKEDFIGALKQHFDFADIRQQLNA